MERLLKIFDIVPGWIYALVIAALLAGGGTLLAVEKGKLALEQKDHAQTRLDFANYQKAVYERENQRTQAAMQEQEAKREVERNRSKAAQESMNALLNETARVAADRARADERGRMRDNLIDAVTARSSGGGQGGGDPAALRRAEEAAATTGSLLKTCRAEGRSDGAEFEALAGQLRSVISQYESLLSGQQAGPPATPGSRSD